MKTQKIAVTGAFGYSGKYVAKILLKKNIKVMTLTNSMHKNNPFGGKIEVKPLDFKNQLNLEKSLIGTNTLINTYWVRFNHKKFNHNKAVENSKILFNSAKNAGVNKIVHVSITNPNIKSELEYFKGKAELENYLKNIKIKHSIVRPAVLFGGKDILINNIAWMIRKLPVMGVFGKGDYKIQPIYVKDFAEILVKESLNSENKIINAIGPESFTYIELIKTIMQIIEIKKPVLKVRPVIAYIVGKIIGKIKNDVTITKPEIRGLMQNLLYVNSAPTGKTKLTDWAKQNKKTIGKKYANELSRR